jgi:ABC-type uncharacterized transport system ATPase subunit
MALACSVITKRYFGYVAVDDVSLAVPLGEMVGIVGAIEPDRGHGCREGDYGGASGGRVR